MGSGVFFRTVRRIQQWDGRTVGVIRTGLGAEYVVWKSGKGNRWDALSGVSVSDLAE